MKNRHLNVAPIVKKKYATSQFIIFYGSKVVEESEAPKKMSTLGIWAP